jgi:hypothetical protein
VIATADRQRLAGRDVRVVTPAFFLATKLEAFRGWGGGDVFTSHDLEDIVTVMDGRPEIVEEVAGAAVQVRESIAREIQALLDDGDFIDALPGFLLPDAANQARRGFLETRLRALCNIS